MKSSKAKTRYYIYAIALLPMLLLLGSGIVMLKYSTGYPVESTISKQTGSNKFKFNPIWKESGKCSQ